ncbi:hypothetical protein ACFV1L_17310 [Kitasatospora sp. NPDC059646]|uniref:hypothetical protein n=1 Tax=Kitasatospora sp. NPDC059646 TaxID=3346893 RepID=UPI003696981A
MELRAELRPPVVTGAQQAGPGREIERIAGLLTAGGQEAGDAVRAFNRATGHHYGPLDFTEYQGSRSLAEFAVEAARPARPQIGRVSRDELVELVRRALEAGPDADWYLRVVQAAVTHPAVTDVLFWGPAGATPEEMAAELAAHRPIAL